MCVRLLTPLKPDRVKTPNLGKVCTLSQTFDMFTGLSNHQPVNPSLEV
jgi:hypothetical protein